MGMSDLVFDIFAIDRASAVFTRVGDAADTTAARVERGSKMMQQSFLVAGAVAVGLGIKSLEMAANFDAATTKIVALGAESPNAMKRVSQGMLDMTGKVGATAQELADAMYYVEGSGFHGAHALNVLRDAAKGAAIENANVTDVARALSGLLKDYTGTSLTAAAATNAMSGAVAHGGLSFQELAEALPNIGSRAAAANIPVQELLGAVATMTTDQLPAAKAATYLGQTIGQLAAPTAKAQKAMASLGVDSHAVAAAITSGSGHGLADALALLQKGVDHAGKSGETAYQALATTVGGVKSLQGALMLGGKHAHAFASTVDDISAKIKAGGSAIDGFAQTQDTLSFKWKSLKGDASALAVEIGHDLTPAAKEVLGVMSDLFNFLTDHRTVLEGIGVGVGVVAAAFTALKVAQLGVVVVNGVMAASEAAVALGMSASALAAGDLSGAMAGLSLAMDATPFGLVATAIGGVVAGIVALNGGFSHSDAAAKVNQQRISDLASTYDTLTGAITKATRSSVAHDLQTTVDNTPVKNQFGHVVAGPQTNALAIGSKMGINSHDLISAAMGSAKAIEVVRAAMAKYAKTSDLAIYEVNALKTDLGIETGTVHKSAAAAREAWLENQNLAKALKSVKGGTELAHSAYIANIQDLATLAAKHKWTGQEIQTVINAEWQPAMAKAQGITKTNVQAIVASMNGLGGNAKGAMRSSGADAAAGLVAGFSPVIGQMAALGAQAFLAAEAAIRKHGQMHSPSRKMHKAGTDLGDGLTIGFRESTASMAEISARATTAAISAASKHTKKELERALAADSKALAKVNQQIQAAQSWGQAFGGNVFGADLTTMTTSTSTSTIGGSTVTASGAVPSSPAGILQQMFAYQHQQQQQAHVLDNEIKKLAGEGLSQSVLNQMASSGTQGLAEIAALAAASPSQVKEFGSLVNSTNSYLSDAGAYATSGTSMSNLQKQHHDDARQIANIKKALHNLTIKMDGHHHGHLRTA